MTRDILKYPLRVVRDMKGVEAQICDAANRVIADRMIGDDASEIVEVLNAHAGYTVPNPLYVDENGNG